MALTNKDSKWEIKNSLFIILAFIPIINCMVFFHMSSRVQNKKWTLLGWLTLVLNIILIIGTILCSMLMNSSPYQYDHSTEPSLKDYLGYNYMNEYDGYSDYSATEEYAQYEKDRNDWLNTPENKEIKSKRDAWHNSCEIGMTIIMIVFSIYNLIVIFLVFIERPKYLKLLANQENKRKIKTQFSNAVSPIDNPQTIQRDIASQTESKKKIDINSDTEDEIATIPGITIIDAKKAISYREANGAFKTTDEFFNVINAKPHVVAQAEHLIVIGEVKQSETLLESSGKRRIDL